MKISTHQLEMAMASKGHTFKTLSETSGISTATLSYIYNGKKCRPDIAYKLAKAFDMSVECLIESE